MHKTLPGLNCSGGLNLCGNDASPCTTCGVRFLLRDVFPGYAKNAYTGLISSQPSGCACRRHERILAPGGAFFATPEVTSGVGDCTPNGVRGLIEFSSSIQFCALTV